MIQLDFSENWTTKYQDEISACYYNNKQFTVHPMVIYSQTEKGLQHHNYVGLTEDTSHTTPTILAFIYAVIIIIFLAFSR